MRRLISWLPWLAVILSGAAALAHELLWTRRLIDLLGATHETTSRVIACFFLGISMGAAIVSVVLPHAKRPWRWAAIIEFGIAALCLPIFFLPEAYSNVWRQMGPEQLGTTQARMLKLGISALLVTPPAFLMGCTLPVMVAGLLESKRELARHGVLLYALNTAGGVVGILGTAHLALWYLGVRQSMLLAIILNVVTALLCAVLDLTWAQAEPGNQASLESAEVGPEPTNPRAEIPPMRRSLISATCFLAFASGFGVLAFEVLCLHLYSHAVSNFNATTTVLAAFIFVLFLGAAVLPQIVGFGISARRVIVHGMGAAAFLIPLTPLVFIFWTGGLAKLYEGYPTQFAHTVAVMTMVLASSGLAIFTAALVFPALIASLENRDRSADRRWGTLLAFNGLGGAIGAELTNQVLMTHAGLYLSFGFVGMGYALAALAYRLVSNRAAANTLDQGQQDKQRVGGVAPALGLIAAALISVLFLPTLPVTNQRFRAETLATYPGPDGVVAVVERTINLPNAQRISRSIIWNAQYTLGGSISKPYERRQMILPMLLHPAPRDVASLGVATGISAGAALDVPGVESLVAIDLSRQVLDAAESEFEFHSNGLFRDDRVTILAEDARTYVEACRDRFDMVVGDFFRPHATGEGRLFTTEHFTAVKNALRPGGHFCQWVPCYQVDEREIEVILATFLDVFEMADIWCVNLKTQYNAYGIVGYRDGAADFDGLDARCQVLRKAGTVLDPPCRHPEGIAMHYVGRVDADDIATDERNTLDNLWLELVGGHRDATHSAFDSSLVNTNFQEYHRQLRRRADSSPAGDLAKWIDVGQQLIDWAYAASRQNEDAPQLFESAQQAIPDVIMQDADADWSYWPAE